MQPEIKTHKFMLVGLEVEIDMGVDFSVVVSTLTDKLLEKVSDIPHITQPPRTINFWYPRFADGAPMASEPQNMFFTGVEVTSLSETPVDMSTKDFPESLFAVFVEARRGTVGGPEGYAYQTWLPTSGYKTNEQLPGDLEVYKDLLHTGYEDECKIYIPISCI